jgi:predicted transcriptional regulator
MKVLWRCGEGTVHDVVDALPKQVAYTTALTMLRILEQKGYVEHVPHPAGGRAHLYRPTTAEESVRRNHVRDLVDRVFGGSAEELVTGLLRDEKLTRAELETLRAQIDSKLADGDEKDGTSHPSGIATDAGAAGPAHGQTLGRRRT